MVELGRGLCSDFRFSAEKEWLVTNGIGGFACGTVSGVLTRRYHGLLIAALRPPVGRTLLLTKIDDSVTYQERDFYLYANSWSAGSVYTSGFKYLDSFRLDGTIPTWTFAIGDALLEKRVWMEQGANTTYVNYKLVRGVEAMTLKLKTLVNYRDYHGTTRAGNWQMAVDAVQNGLTITANEGASPFYLLSPEVNITPEHAWYRNFHLAVEAYRGEESTEDNLCVGAFSAEIHPSQTLTLIASTNPNPDLDSTAALKRQRQHEQTLLDQAPPSLWQGATVSEKKALQQLVLAADQFIVERTVNEQAGRTIIAGYPWFSDWGRDTMIALTGLTLVTGRADVARFILQTFSHLVDQGMLPNRFPDEGTEPEYNTVDATLWYFEAVATYWRETHDTDLLHELFPTLREIVAWHVRGTRYHIRQDPHDGLLYAGEEGVQLTWMDAKVGDWVVTPRIGKPVEVNALWFNALARMVEFATALGEDGREYERMKMHVQAGFGRFWNEELECCYDVIGGPLGWDDAIRPNQLLAVSLPHSPLTVAQQKAVVDICTRQLVTPYGLRSLARSAEAYTGRYGGNRHERDGAYHQGTVWGWLIGPFVTAHLRVYNDPDIARSYLSPLLNQLHDHGLGSISEIFDGEPPHPPRGCFAQAWSVAELLRTWRVDLSIFCT